MAQNLGVSKPMGCDVLNRMRWTSPEAGPRGKGAGECRGGDAVNLWAVDGDGYRIAN